MDDYPYTEPAPDFWTVAQFKEFRIGECFVEPCHVLLPNGEIAPDDMTLGVLRELYKKKEAS